MIGIRVGLKVGERVGIAEGIGEDELGGAPPTTLSVTVVDSADPVISFANYDYTLTVTNTGTNTAYGVTATLTLDVDTSFVSGGGLGWSVSALGNIVTCTRSSIDAGVAAPNITIGVRAPDIGETSSATANARAGNAPPATPDTETTLVNQVDRDPTKNAYVPSSTTQWTDFISYFSLTASPPSHIWLCQEASGNLADSIGAMPLNAAGTPLYEQVAVNWSRLGVAMDMATTDRFVAGAGVGPNPGVVSTLWLVMTNQDLEAASYTTLFGNATSNLVNSTRCGFSPSAGVNRLICNSDGANNFGAVDHVNGQYALAIKNDQTNSLVASYSTLEKVSGVFNAAVNDVGKGIGGFTSMGGTQVVYACLFSGAAAEIDDAALSALFQALGFPVTGW